MLECMDLEETKKECNKEKEEKSYEENKEEEEKGRQRIRKRGKTRE